MAPEFTKLLGLAFVLMCCTAGAHSVPDLRMVSFAYRHPFAQESLVSSLSDETQESILEEAVDLLIRHPNIHVFIRGYADDAECLHANCQALSDRRARLVYDWLVAHGVAENQLEGRMGFGNTQPIDFEETEAQRSHNRRVEFGLTYVGDPWAQT